MDCPPSTTAAPHEEAPATWPFRPQRGVDAKIFDHARLERLSRVHPATPAVLFIPVVLTALAFARQPTWLVALLFVAGVLAWTLTEYVIHRFVFHLWPIGPITYRLLFLAHGVHHAHPDDADRLVMPPIVSIPTAIATALTFRAVLGPRLWLGFFAGFVAGYVVYDSLHYFIHHHRPRTAIGKLVTRHHLRHHFKDTSSRFGVSSPLWDFILGTLPKR
jgi:dihydroceramide fatty acyl 2-hydroxylase